MNRDDIDDAHGYRPGCTCDYSFNGVLDSLDEECPVLAEERAQHEVQVS